MNDDDRKRPSSVAASDDHGGIDKRLAVIAAERVQLLQRDRTNQNARTIRRRGSVATKATTCAGSIGVRRKQAKRNITLPALPLHPEHAAPRFVINSNAAATAPS